MRRVEIVHRSVGRRALVDASVSLADPFGIMGNASNGRNVRSGIEGNKERVVLLYAYMSQESASCRLKVKYVGRY